MDVNAAQAAFSSGNKEAEPQKKGLGKDEFLRLLMAQLGHQDPLSPMDSQAFVAQLAQFATVEQMQAQSQRLDAILVAQAGANQLQAASLVGKDALYKSGAVAWPGEGTSPLNGTLSGPAATVTAVIKDASGKTVRRLDLGPREAGSLEASWDGRDDAGALLPAGTYTVSLTAADAEGKAVDVESLSRGRIAGVSFEAGYAELLLGRARIKLADVLRVEAPRG